MANAPNWGFFSDLPGYSGRFNNFHISQEPPIDYDEVGNTYMVSFVWSVHDPWIFKGSISTET